MKKNLRKINMVSCLFSETISREVGGEMMSAKNNALAFIDEIKDQLHLQIEDKYEPELNLIISGRNRIEEDSENYITITGRVTISF